MNLWTTMVALVNGMIGGSILVLPLVSLQAGWLESILVILFTGVFSYYSCYLSILHLGDQVDLDHALLRHFNGSKFLKVFYDFCVWSGILLLLTLYFELIVIQWEGLIPPYKPTYTNPCVNGLVIIVWCLCLKFFEFGAHIMGYGIVSIVGYLIFLIWVVASAPTGNHSIPAVGTGLAGFAAMMGNAFSIQGFFIPVMKCCKSVSKHNFILFLAFLIGGLAYLYIAFMGSFGKAPPIKAL
jgi:hypothetical protein